MKGRYNRKKKKKKSGRRAVPAPPVRGPGRSPFMDVGRASPPPELLSEPLVKLSPANRVRAEKIARKVRADAERGDVKSLNIYGGLLATGAGVQRDRAAATKWFRRAAERGDSEGQCNFGISYLHGLGVEQDYAEAAKWLRRAAEQGDAEARDMLEEMYKDGKVPSPESSSALVGEDNPDEEEILRRGRVLRPIAADLVKEFLPKAEQGDPSAQFELSMLYMAGPLCGLGDKDAEGVEWCRRSALQDYAPAQVLLGNMYRDGQGVVADPLDAIRWHRRAVELEDPLSSSTAARVLGEMYRDGAVGVPQDYEEAAKWFRRAVEIDAEMLYPCAVEAAKELSVLYLHGNGVPQDCEEASKFLRLSTEAEKRQSWEWA